MLRTFLLLLLITSGYFGNSQSQGFGRKQKKDTLLNLNSLKAKTIRYSGNPSFKTQSSTGRTFSFKPEKDNDLIIIKGRDKHGKPNFIKIIQDKNSSKTQGARTFNPTNKINTEETITSVLKLDSGNHFILKKESGLMSRWQQTFNHTPVYGTEIIVHKNRDGLIETINGQWESIIAPEEKHSFITENNAIEIAEEDLKTKGLLKPIPKAFRDLLKDDSTTSKLVIYKNSYAYEITLRANLKSKWAYIIDAETGNIMQTYSQSCHVAVTTTSTDLNNQPRQINTFLEGGTYQLIDATKPMYDPTDFSGLIRTVRATGDLSGNGITQITSPDNTWSPTATSAHYNASAAYNFYLNNYNRNSIDGGGGTIYSVINYKDEFGNDLDNAFWTSPFMVYGNGDESFRPLAAALDVAGHEMTHGVIEAEANLVYQGESGAINESYADIFACLIDSMDWLIGEDIVIPAAFPSGALRNLRNPNNGGNSLGDRGWQPAHVSEQYLGPEDNGGVHINSGITNRAFYLIATNLGRLKGGDIYYYALQNYLTRFTQFIDLRIAIVQSATDLYGGNSEEVEVIRSAFDSVGILEGNPTDIASSLPINPGEERIVFVDQNMFDPITIYDTDLSTYNPLSETEVQNRPSISDNGEIMAFIGTDNRLYISDIRDPLNPQETLYFSDPVFSSVSLSKDGTKIALTTMDQDTSIYVHDMVSEETVRYKLYNPTYTQDINSKGVLYADALEWDYSGEKIIYDAFNYVVNQNGEDLEFWDIGIIEVWDNEANDFGTGKIEKLFTRLEKGESIGNPTLSKNSPYIMAMDYSVETENGISFYVLGYNIQTDELGVILENNYIAWPSYSKDDRNLIFTYLDQISGDDLITGTAAIALNPDKISSADNGFAILEESQYASFYTKGERDIVISALNNTIDEQITVYPNPVTGENITIDGVSTLTQGTLKDLTGNIIEEFTLSPNANQQIRIPRIKAGIYFFHLKNDKEDRIFKLVVQ